MDTLIAELQKSPLEKLCVSLREYEGHLFIDIRLYFGDDEVWSLTNGPDMAASCHVEGVTGQGRWHHGMLPRLLQPIEAKDQTPMPTYVC